MSAIKYHYALDENEILVHVDDVSAEHRREHRYHCINCGAEMILRAGEIRSRHFAHKVNQEHCSCETYLHRLAKRKIKEKFDSGGKFEIAYFQRMECSCLETCPFVDKDECHDRRLVRFDLRKYYDMCREEYRVNGYVADLFLSHSVVENRKPVFQSIQVSHKCTEQKRESGLKIIEIYIRSEDDIRALLERPLSEHEYARYRDFRGCETAGYAKFYGFARESCKRVPLEKKVFRKFFLFNSGKAYVNYYMSCIEAVESHNKNACMELLLDSRGRYDLSFDEYDYGYLWALDKGIHVRSCNLCRFHEKAYTQDRSIFCRLYKKCGTPQFPKAVAAIECPYYEMDNEAIAEIREEMSSIQIADVTE